LSFAVTLAENVSTSLIFAKKYLGDFGAMLSHICPTNRFEWKWS